jgi:hypothetical protein
MGRGASRRPISAAVAFLAVLCLGSISSTTNAATGPSVRERNSNVFGERYCELLLVYKPSSGFVADVYNTFGLNDCPQSRWQAIDTTAVAKANGALAAVRNGPRFWLMNQIEKFQHGPRIVKDLGGLRAAEEATLKLSNLSTAPYTVHHVNRATTFIWNEGQTVYELHGPDRSVWVMQSWSEQIDPTLARAQLATLGTKLELPAGWSYRVRQLAKPLKLTTVRTAAEVMQDNLDNTYSRIK